MHSCMSCLFIGMCTHTDIHAGISTCTSAYVYQYIHVMCVSVCVCVYVWRAVDRFPFCTRRTPPPPPLSPFHSLGTHVASHQGQRLLPDVPAQEGRCGGVEEQGRGGSETQRTKLVDVCAFVCVRLRVCACVCVLSVCVIVQCVCRAICLHRCIDTHRVHMHARMYAHINACICVCMQHTCLYVCTYVCTYGCVHGFFVCVLYMYACTMHFAGQMSCLKFVMTLFSISCTRICMFTHVYIPFSHSIVLTLHTQPHVNRCTQIWKLLFGAGELLNGLDQVVLALHSSGQFGSYKGAVHHDKRRESTLEKIRNIRARFLGELMYFLNQFIYLFTWSGEQIQDRSASFLLQLTPCTQLAGTLAIYTSGCC